MSRFVIIGPNGFLAKNFIKYLKDINYNFTLINFRKIFNDSEMSDELKKKIILSQLKIDDTIIFFSSPAHNSVKKKEINKFFLNFQLFLEALGFIKINKIIYLSSFKVIDENSDKRILNSNSIVNPQTYYGNYKYKSEKILKDYAIKYKFNYISLRVPLVIGEGVKGNFKKLIKYIKFGLPLPKKLLLSKRNFISTNNLNKIIIKISDNNKLNNLTLSVHDGNNYSMIEIIKIICLSINKKPTFITSDLFNNSIKWLFKNTSIYKKIFSNFVIDCSKDLESINYIPQNDIYDEIFKINKSLDNE